MVRPPPARRLGYLSADRERLRAGRLEPALSRPSTSLRDTIARRGEIRRSSDHVFWQDSVSVCDSGSFQPAFIQGHRQLSDVYLLALAVANEGRLATFDRNVPLKAVAGAGPQHLEIVGRAD